MKVEDFKEGDGVSHSNIGDGYVTKVDSEGVHITYHRKTVKGRTISGIYDDAWFQNCDFIRKLQ